MREKLKEVPRSCGVYVLKGKKGEVLYIGKAVNLRERLSSYFLESGDSRFLFSYLVREVKDFEWVITDNEKEALLLEDRLIKRYKPRYNVKLRDDKTYVNLKINITHPFPGVWIERRPRKSGNLILGPFSSVSSLRETLNVLTKVFRLRTCSDREISRRTRPCLEYEMKRCSAPCVGFINQDEYRKNLEEFLKVFKGEGERLIKELEVKMWRYAEEEKFENAALMRDRLDAVKKTLEKQVIYTGTKSDFDVLGVVNDERVAFSVISVRNGVVDEVHTFPFSRLHTGDDILHTFIVQYYTHEKYIPPRIIVKEGAVSRYIEEILSERAEKQVKVVSPHSDYEAELLEMAEVNARERIKTGIEKEMKIEGVLDDMRRKFQLQNYPHRIECFDVSNIFGTYAVGSKVLFEGGEPVKEGYRRYRVKKAGIDDYNMIYEIIVRRLKSGKEDGDLPDLIIIDGGIGHLNTGLKACKDEGVKGIDVISIAKGARRRRGRKGDVDKVYIKGVRDPIEISPSSDVGKFIMRIRDEAHRFAIEYHRMLMNRSVSESFFLSISGIGPKKAKQIVCEYPDMESIITAKPESIATKLKVSLKIARNIKRKAEEIKKEIDR